jgi:predicted SPOUT superfamily RNA methylase MTH1
MTVTQTSRTPLPLTVAIPSSFLDVYSNKAQKTQQIGRIARAAAIFQVDEILVYLDRRNGKQLGNQKFIIKVLEYVETPQYLRKHLFGKIPELQYAGLLPPLRTPHHPLEKRRKALKDGEIREGYAFVDGKKTVIDIGVEVPLPLLDSHSGALPTRMTVKVTQTKPGEVVARPVASPWPLIYWGYTVIGAESLLGEFLTTSSSYDFVIALSRKGVPIHKKGDLLQREWQEAKRLVLLFGSHKEGLSEILKREGYQLSSVVNHTINLLAFQGVATVRTEEAVGIGLASFRLIEQKR